MLVKYPFIFPISIKGYPDQLYRQLSIHMHSNRKSEHLRLFRVDFDGRGNVLARDERTLIKHVVAKEEELLAIKEPS